MENLRNISMINNYYHPQETTQESHAYFETSFVDFKNGSGHEITWAMPTIKDDDMSADFIKFLKLYFAPVLLLAGTLGNILSFVVFLRPALKPSATSFYFRMLAVADTLALNFGLWPNWLRDAFGIHVYPMNDAACRIQTYLRYTLSDCASWVLVIMSIHRAVVVQWPHQTRHLFNRFRVRASVLLLVVVLGALNIPAIWINTSNDDPTGYPCTVTNIVLAYSVWPWIDLTLYCLLPFVIMITSSVVIIRVVYRSQALSTRGSVSSIRQDKVTALTITLLVVTFVYLLLTAPFALYAITVYEFHTTIKVNFELFYIVASFLRYINNSINFLLYCLSAETFRTELLYLCRKDKRKLLQYSNSGTNHSLVPVRRDSISSTGDSMVSNHIETPVFLESTIYSTV